MRLFTDKYRPLYHSSVNADCTNDDEPHERREFRLKDTQDGMPHMLIYGPEGSGKLCWIQNYLASHYDKSAHNLKTKHWEFQLSNKQISLSVLYSPFHFIINPSVHGSNDKLVMMSFLNEIGSTPAVLKYFGPSSQTCGTMPKHRIVVVTGADNLSYSAQRSLTNIMEKSIDNCRFVLSCRSLSKIIDPVISRCIKSRLCPDESALYEIAVKVCKAENIEIKDDFLRNLVLNSSGNIRYLLNNLQIAAECGKYKDNKMLPHMQCSEDSLISTVINGFDVDQLPQIRKWIYDSIFVHQVPGSLIYKLTKNFVKMSLDNHKNAEVLHKLLESACHYDEACCKGSKLIIHYEAFILQIAEIFERN